MRLGYDVAICLMGAGIWLAQPFSAKARYWVSGRIHWREHLRPIPTDRWPVLWMHVASLGEFEQGRPILEAFRHHYPKGWIILSFFSPSGYRVRRDYSGADVVCYLPLDTRRNARNFIEHWQPDVAIFVKYDFWANYLFELKRREVPTFLISALFRPEQPFFRPWGDLWRQMLQCFSHIFTQNESSTALLHRIGVQHVSTAGDTRVDRVLRLAQESTLLDRPPFEADIVAGSTWPADEAVLLPAIHHPQLAHMRWIIAPHEPSKRRVRRLVSHLRRPWVLYSHWDGRQPAEVMVVDSVGLLARLYRYGRLAYIGGGFGRGIHNTLEPAAYGLPVLFGPNYRRFKEACQFVRRGGGFPVKDFGDLLGALRQLEDPEEYQRASAAVKRFLSENEGATEQIWRSLCAHLEQRPR